MYIHIEKQPSTVYHYTKRENLASILRDGKIRRFEDRESWFCLSIPDTLELMRSTVMMEGKPYYKTDGSLGFYPRFQPEDYVVLKLEPLRQNGQWVRWIQELPPGTAQKYRELALDFSLLKIGFRGDLKFREAPEVFEAAPLLRGQYPSLLSCMDAQEQTCFQYGKMAAEAGTQCAPCYDDNMNGMVAEARSEKAGLRDQRNMSAWTLGYLSQWLAERKLLDEELFGAGVAALFPTAREGAVLAWSVFTECCVDEEQYVDFLETEPDETIAQSRWFDTLLASFARLKQGYGDEIAQKVLDMGVDGLCLYPFEMEAGAKEISLGAGFHQLCELVNEGKLDAVPFQYPKLADTLEIQFPVPIQGMNMTF